MRTLNSEKKKMFEALVRLSVAGLETDALPGGEVSLNRRWHCEFISPGNSALRVLAEAIGLTKPNPFFSFEDFREILGPDVLEEVWTAKVQIGEYDTAKTCVLVNFLVYYEEKIRHWSLEIISSTDSVFYVSEYLKGSGGGKDGSEYKTLGWRFGIKNQDVLRHIRKTCQSVFVRMHKMD